MAKNLWFFDKAVENIYKTPKALLYFLSSTNDTEEELESGILTKVRYTDVELYASIENICQEKYNGRKYDILRIEDKYRVARELRKRYGVGAKQLSRITFLDYETLKAVLGI